MISQVDIKTETGEILKGVLLDSETLNKVIELFDTVNANGLKSEDAVLLLKLKEARANLKLSLEEPLAEA